MRPGVAIRWTGAWWFIPVLFALATYVALADSTDFEGYIAAEYAAASRGVVVVAPLLAAATSFLAPRLDRFLLQHEGQRKPTTSLAIALWPLLVGGPLALVAAIVGATRLLPKDWASMQMLLVLTITVLAAGISGVVASRALGPLVSLAVAPVAWFLWLAIPGSQSSVALRNMNSSFVGCCTSSQQPAGNLVLGSCVLAAALIIGCVYILDRSHGRGPALGAVAGITSLAFCASWVAATQLGHKPNLLAVEDRTTGVVCESGDDLEICVWPEHVSMMRQVREGVISAHKGLTAVEVVDESVLFTERAGGSGTRFTLSAESTPDTIRYSIAQGLMPPYRQCVRAGSGQDYEKVMWAVATSAGIGKDALIRILGYESRADVALPQDLAQLTSDCG